MKHLFSLLIIIQITTVNGQAFQWAKSIGAPASEYATSIATDNHGHIYLTGYFQQTVDFDPGLSVFNLTAAGAHDLFICKLDTAGNFVWALRMGGVGEDRSNCIKIDSSGNIYTTGTFNSTVDFDPGVGVYNLGSAEDIFVSKLDSAGNFIWAKKMGGIAHDEGLSLAIDKDNNVYTSGMFGATCDFDPGAGIFNLNASGEDIFISKLDSNGDFLWAIDMGGPTNDRGNSIALDSSGNVFCTGYFQVAADFDPGVGTYTLFSNGSHDCFITKYDTAGHFIFAKQVGGTGQEFGNNLEIDFAGNLYVTGYFSNTVDFDPGPAVNLLSCAGYYDAYILKLDNNGSFLWSRQMGGTDADYGMALTVDNNSSVYIIGYFNGSADFDPGNSVCNLSSAGNDDVFILKLDSAGIFHFANKLGGIYDDWAFALVIDNSGSLYTVGSFSDVVDFDPDIGVYNIVSIGYHDIFLHKYNRCGAIFDAYFSDCYSFTIYGTTYTSSGNYIKQFIDAGGCDSNLNMHIQIDTTTYLTITASACKVYILNGQVYTSSGVYTQTFVNAANCDSIVTLNLSINGPNTTVAQSGATLTATATGATYQWLTCNPFQNIVGEIGQTFIATANGDYAVVVTQNGCTDTSACLAVAGIGIIDYSATTNIRLYPNPITQKLFMESEIAFQNASIKILNIAGQTMLEKDNISTGRFEVDMSKLVSGTFFVEIAEKGHKFIRVVTKE